MISYSENYLESRAQELAIKFGFALNQTALPRLQVTPEGLVLLTQKFSPMKADFSSAVAVKRYARGKEYGVVKACKPSRQKRILDLTAGWGNDASLLAAFKSPVVMLERQALMAALLEDGLERLALSSHPLPLKLVHIDALTYLAQLTPQDYPDLIYIDPMHPARQKSALVKKEMQILQQLWGPDHDVDCLINAARACAREKVIVKWPERLEPLIKPIRSIHGETVRFDVY